MKYLLLLSIITTLSSETFGQTVKTTVDDFTGRSISETSMVILQRTMTTVVAMTGYKDGDNQKVKLSVTYPTDPVVIQEGGIISFKLSNGNIINLENPNIEVLSQTVRLFLSLNESQIDELSKNRIEMIRVNTKEGFIDFKDFNDPKKDQVMKLFSLIR